MLSRCSRTGYFPPLKKVSEKSAHSASNKSLDIARTISKVRAIAPSFMGVDEFKFFPSNLKKGNLASEDEVNDSTFPSFSRIATAL